MRFIIFQWKILLLFLFIQNSDAVRLCGVIHKIVSTSTNSSTNLVSPNGFRIRNADGSFFDSIGNKFFPDGRVTLKNGSNAQWRIPAPSGETTSSGGVIFDSRGNQFLEDGRVLDNQSQQIGRWNPEPSMNPIERAPSRIVLGRQIINSRDYSSLPRYLEPSTVKIQEVTAPITMITQKEGGPCIFNSVGNGFSLAAERSSANRPSILNRFFSDAYESFRLKKGVPGLPYSNPKDLESVATDLLSKKGSSLILRKDQVAIWTSSPTFDRIIEDFSKRLEQGTSSIQFAYSQHSITVTSIDVQKKLVRCYDQLAQKTEVFTFIEIQRMHTADPRGTYMNAFSFLNDSGVPVTISDVTTELSRIYP